MMCMCQCCCVRLNLVSALSFHGMITAVLTILSVILGKQVAVCYAECNLFWHPAREISEKSAIKSELVVLLHYQIIALFI